jgi:hypothetical protein
MKVRELIARLEKTDPEDTVLIDPGSQSLLLVNQRPGMFQPWNGLEALTFTETDKELLRVLRVRL